jgi:uncharacterized protein (TIGR03437 family)
MRIALLLLFAVVTSQAEQFGKGWWHGRSVTYKIRNGIAIYQGDIILGKAADIPQTPPVPEPTATSGKSLQPEALHPDASFYTGINNQYLWTNGVVPYIIDAAFTGSSLNVINQAIQFYNNNTPVKWTPRTTETNYVHFTPFTECYGQSNEAMAGGEQEIDLNADFSKGCINVGTVEHEMGHTVGLEHEQTRWDRDYYVHLNIQNMDKNNIVQFQPSLGNIDLLPYNQGSIMHYSIEDYQRNNLTTIDTMPLGIPVSHRANLSPGDIEAIKTMYGGPSSTTTVYTDPAGLNVIVDGQSVKTPVVYKWTPGSMHMLDVADGPQQMVKSIRSVFARWSNDGPRSQTITATPETRIITANFSLQYLVVANVGKAGGGTVTVNPPSPDGFYTNGALLTVTATPAAGNTFLQWDNPAGVSSWHGMSTSPASFVVDAAGYAYTADFTKSPVTTITTAIPGTSVSVDGTTVYLPASLTWTAGSKHTLDVPMTTQDMGYTGSPFRYTFQGWGDGGATSHSITASASSTTLAANWQLEWLVSTYTVDPNYSNSGTLAVSPVSSACGYPTPTDCYYPAGTQLTFTPTPKGAFVFTGWSDDLSGNTVPGSLTVHDQVYLTANFAQPARLTLSGIVNAASYDNLGVSPGELITIFGLQFGPPAQLVGAQLNGNTLATTLAQTQVLFDGRAAPLIYVSANQISAIVPYEVAGQATTRMVISYQGKRGNAVAMPVLPTHPGLFTLDSSGSGLVVALNQDNSLHGVNNPAARGTVVQLYGTGMGVTNPAAVDGQLVGQQLPMPTASVQVLIAGRNAQVQYFGGAPGLANGIFQANVVIPPDCPTGLVPISVTMGGYTNPATTRVAVQ